jgi:hypothetical protein
MSATLSISETQVFGTLRSVMLTFGLLPANPNTTLEIDRGQINRVPEPAGPDYVVLWPLMMDRLATNVDTAIDASFIGSIAGNVLTVTEVMVGPVASGQTLYPAGASAACQVSRQLTGPTGGIGTYQVTPTANLGAGTVYNGTSAKLQMVEWTVQCDVHGPASSDNATRISTLWRDQFCLDACVTAGGIIAPLYTSDPRQTAFENAEQQTEERWSVDLCMQVNPVVSVTQQFAGTLEVSPYAVDVLQPAE